MNSCHHEARGVTLDLVSVFCNRDLSMQLLQAQSIARHFDRDGLGRVFYVWNDTREVPNGLSAELTACFDGIRFELVHASHLGIAPSAVDIDGWTTQQAAKLLTARLVAADHYLVLDAKNHFVWPCTVSDFLAPDGQAFASIGHIGNDESFRYGLNYFGICAKASQVTGVLNVTPFLLQTELVRRLLVALEQKNGSVTRAFLAHQHKLTEFMSYQAYARVQGIDTAKLFRPARECIAETIWAATVQDDGDFDRCVQRATRGETKVLGLHWMACCLLSEVQRATVCRLWTSRGLTESDERGENAIAMLEAGLTGADKAFLAKSMGIASHCRSTA